MQGGGCWQPWGGARSGRWARVGAHRAAAGVGVPAGSPQALYIMGRWLSTAVLPQCPRGGGGDVSQPPPGGGGTAAAVCGCRGAWCQQLLARGERLPGSPARCHLVFISFPKSLLLRGDAQAAWGGGVPLPTAHSAAALLLGGVGDPWSHPKNAHGGLWGHHRSAPSPKTRGLVLWGGGAAPPKAGVWLPVPPPPQILGIPKLLEPGEPTGCLGNCGQDGEVQGSGWHGDGESRCLGDGTHPSCTQGCWGGPALRPAGPGGVLGVLAARRKTGG